MGTLKKNFAFAFGAQGLQLIQSVLWSLLIPKLLGVEQFGYWQLFIFYTQYGGFLSFGMIDGTYLEIGGQEYKKLNYSFLGYQLRMFVLWQLLILLPVAIYGMNHANAERSFTIITSCIYVILANVMGYLMYVLQAVNEIKYMSFGRMLTTICFLSSILVLLFLRIDIFEPYVICYMICNSVCMVYYITKTKEILAYTFSLETSKGYLNHLIKDIKVGSVLLLSNICGMLVLGFGRFMVDEEWGIKAFSVVSFSFMFVNFFMTFVQQGSLVLFPELRRWDEERIRWFYVKLRRIMSLIFPSVLLLYLPIYYLVELWLPQYLESAKYLLFLLPLCIFDTKMNLLCNTLFKVLNHVKSLLLCNVLALAFSALGIIISIFAIKSMIAVVSCMLLSIILRSVVAEVMLSKMFITASVWKNLGMELFMVALFIFSNIWAGINIAFIIYAIATMLRFALNKTELKMMIERK